MDSLLADLLPQWLAEGYQVVITSDHGMNNDLSHGGTLAEGAGYRSGCLAMRLWPSGPPAPPCSRPSSVP